MKYFIVLMLVVWLFFAGVVAFAQDAAPAPTVPTIQGTISFMFEDGTIESLNSEGLFMTQGECYETGRAAVQGFLPQLPAAIGHLILCEPAGDDI